MKSQGFTLIELLVVVLIIGILAAIAVPQYQKAVMKANLHKGIPLVESLYQAQQAYYLANGNFAADVDDLDVSIPRGCTKRQVSSNSKDSKYDCPWGVVGINSGSNMQYIEESQKLLYTHYYKNATSGSLSFKAGQRYCFGVKKKGQEICQSLNGERMEKSCSATSNSWCHFEIK